MYFAELAVLLASCYNIVKGFSLYGHRDGINNIFKQFTDIALMDSTTIETKWIRQPLDHFDKAENRTWKMRYFRRLDMWKPNGPIFLFMNGEGAAGKGFLQTGMMYELAKETNGAMFLSEHRYYGDSKPFGNYTSENLKYLSSRQALADNAKLLSRIKSMSRFYFSKVVVVGGSYAGNLAAWMKLKYPGLVDAAIASSAPVLAKADFFEYLETVSDDFEQYGTSGCFEQIHKIFKRYEDLFKTDDGIKTLKKEEHICNSTDMNKLENQQLFFLDKASEFMSLAQYGDLDDIKNHCEEIHISSHLKSSKDDELNLWNAKAECYDFELNSMIENMKRIDWLMAWYYQTCTEFGYYQTSNSKNHPFTDNISIELYYNMCRAIYGSEFDEKRVEDGILVTNEMYGGLSPDVTKVVFVNGELEVVGIHRFWLTVLAQLLSESAPASWKTK